MRTHPGIHDVPPLLILYLMLTPHCLPSRRRPGLHNASRLSNHFLVIMRHCLQIRTRPGLHNNAPLLLNPLLVLKPGCLPSRTRPGLDNTPRLLSRNHFACRAPSVPQSTYSFDSFSGSQTTLPAEQRTNPFLVLKPHCLPSRTRTLF